MAKRGGRSGRKYVRDSIGRFATTGATARGGRLKTKSGKKRATQTVKAKTGGKPSGAIKGKIKRDPGAAKPAAAKPTSARDAATARLKIKTATRRKLKADRSSVIPANPKARRVQSARIGSTVAKKARAKGNAPATIANRVKRKAAVNKANLRENTRYGNVVDGKQYERQIKTSMTLDRAQNYLKTGQKGKPTEKARRALLAAKRAPEMAAARTRLNALNAKRAARRKADTGKPAAAKPAAAKRKKTDLQRMQQADRIMGKLAKRQKAVVDKAPSLNEGLKQVRRNNARAARVNQSLASKGLLAKYTRLTAPADPIRMTPAGKGIPKSRKPKRRRS